MKTRILHGIIVTSLLAGTVAPTPSGARWRQDEGDARAIAEAAYIYGYPLVTMAYTRRVLTNVKAPEASGRAPINQFGSLHEYPTAQSRDLVAPNVNTLYTAAMLDLRREPIVVYLPDTQRRYYVMQILDAWTNVIGSPGKRTTGTEAQQIALIGPDWKGTLPQGVTHAYRSSTNTVWAIVWIEADGPKEYGVVNALQREIKAVPLSAFGNGPYTPPRGTVDPSVDMHTSVKKQVDALSADDFFAILASEMTINPPHHEDATIVGQMASIGITAGQPFSPGAARQAILDGVRDAKAKIADAIKTVGRIQNGWQSLVICGQYGTDYLARAVVAVVGFGCNLAADALYPTTFVDAAGAKLSGANRYVIRFPAGQTPPAKAFWSVTIYDADGFLVENSIIRSAISSWMDLKKNSDGSIDIFVQHQPPGTATMESNWLPAPDEDFMLMMRIFWPTQEVILGQWVPPAVTKK